MFREYKYLIVDDDELSRLAVETESARYPFLKMIASCSNAMEASELITAGEPDIVFADIEMPGITGIELVKRFASGGFLPVFITSHPEFAVESYDLHAFDYLLKPLNRERFALCANRLREFFEMKSNAFAFNREQEENFIVIKQGHDKYKIPVHDISYLEAMKDYTKVATVSKQYLVLETITGLHQKLPQDKFIRIHRSYIINRDKATVIKSNSVLVEKKELPVGKMYKHFIDVNNTD